ncbi:MAG: FixH family protein [Nitrospirota bacterium]|nr:FixH family protein [Nitrospirota bacterium]
MKKILFVLLGLFFMSGVVYATGSDMVKKAGDVTVKVSVGKDAPVVGENSISVELLNAEKGSITDAEVELAYFMPAMPAMKYETSAIQKGNTYTAVLGLAMAGQWNVDVRFKRPGRKFEKITFSINAK